MTSFLSAPLGALLTALSLLPMKSCAPPITVEADVRTEILETAEYGVPLPDGKSVEDSWFEDAAFIGHSLIAGFSAYSGLQVSDYYYLSGASVESLLDSKEIHLPGNRIGSLKSEMSQHNYGKIYLMMGINEIAGNLDVLKSDYLNLIDTVREYNSNAEIYVLSVLPVTKRKDAEGDFTIERILGYNNMLMDMCKLAECWYLDLYSCFVGEDGFLPSSASFDGIHLEEEQYLIMLDYLRTHTTQR